MKAKHRKGCSPLSPLAYQNYPFPTPRLKMSIRRTLSHRAGAEPRKPFVAFV